MGEYDDIEFHWRDKYAEWQDVIKDKLTKGGFKHDRVQDEFARIEKVGQK